MIGFIKGNDIPDVLTFLRVVRLCCTEPVLLERLDDGLCSLVE